MPEDHITEEKPFETTEVEDLLKATEPKKFLANLELSKEWRIHYLKAGHSVASTTTYFNYIKLFLFDNFDQEINQKGVDRFMSKHPSGVVSGALKNFFQFLVRKKEFPQEFVYIHFDKSKSKRKFPEALEPIEVEKIISAMGTVGLKEKYFTIVLANLGLRISECLKLKWEDFLWASWLEDRTKQGSVNLKNTKGGK